MPNRTIGTVDSGSAVLGDSIERRQKTSGACPPSLFHRLEGAANRIRAKYFNGGHKLTTGRGRSLGKLRHAQENLRRYAQIGPRAVVWVPESGLGFGNVMYLWLHAFCLRERGGDSYALSTPMMQEWIKRFPAMRQVLIDRNDVRLTDRRLSGWWSDFGVDFTPEELRLFIKLHVAPSLPEVMTKQNCLTVNIRRGNYYSESHFRGTYSFDIQAYVELALDLALSQHGGIASVQVVSDGADWCRLKLDRLIRRYAATVDYVDGLSAVDQFVLLATSSRIIGTNSTFSYWGAYTASALDPQARVIMPRFHARLDGLREAPQLDPRWSVIESIPGGWDA